MLLTFCLKIPAVDWSLSSERVLTMEFCEGGFISDHEYMQKNKISIDEVGAVPQMIIRPIN